MLEFDFNTFSRWRSAAAGLSPEQRSEAWRLAASGEASMDPEIARLIVAITEDHEPPPWHSLIQLVRAWIFAQQIRRLGMSTRTGDL
jgi:hypothetical protein